MFSDKRTHGQHMPTLNDKSLSKLSSTFKLYLGAFGTPESDRCSGIRHLSLVLALDLKRFTPALFTHGARIPLRS
jgi:hypothetical protein